MTDEQRQGMEQQEAAAADQQEQEQDLSVDEAQADDVKGGAARARRTAAYSDGTADI